MNKNKVQNLFSVIAVVLLLHVVVYQFIPKEYDYKHLVKVTFLNGDFVEVYVLTEKESVGNEDIDTYRQSNPRFVGYINVKSVETLSSEIVKERYASNIFLILRYNLSFGTEVHCRLDDNGTLLINKEDTFNWLHRELEKL